MAAEQLSTKHLRWFIWSPGPDVYIALITEAAMIALYWSATHILGDGWESILVFGIITNLCLNVLFPLWWVAFHRKQPLSELGITKKHALTSFISGILLAIFSSVRLFQMDIGSNWLPHLLFNGVILWEPFFVFAWLQMRFDKAFGIIPGILFTAFCFSAYHIGTYPSLMLAVLFLTGLVYAAIFRLTRNILIVWPFVWSIASSIGTLMGGMHFSWNQVAIWSIILLLQLGCIGFLWRRQNKESLIA